MNLNYILQRRKVFKHRYAKKILTPVSFRYGTCGFISLQQQRFELVYLRFIKKLLRRKHIRRKMFFQRRQFWLFLRPNCMLTGKTTNSRMGAGVGALVRLAILLREYISFVEFKHYSAAYLRGFNKAIQHRYTLKFKLEVDYAIFN